MNLLHKTFSSLYKRTYKKPLVNIVKDLFVSNRLKMGSTANATETAVAKIQIRRLMKKPEANTGKWFLLIIPVSSFGLGTWQVFRKFQKEEVNEEFLKRVEQPPVDFPKDLSELEDMEFRRVRVKGKFDHSKEIYMGPRSKVDENSLNKPVYLISTRTAGYMVVTPFTLSDRNLTILVNRGWVPADKKPPSKRQEGQITEEVEFIGLVRHHQNRLPLGAKNVPEKKIWIYRDLNQMAEATGAAPIFIDADLFSSVPGGPVGGQTILELRNEHLSYIYTWYGLCAVSTYMWFLKYFPKAPIVV